MRILLLLVTVGLLAPASGPAPAAGKKTEAKGTKVEYEVHTGYLMRLKAYWAARAADKSKLGLFCFLAFNDRDSFDKAFAQPDGGKVNLNELIPSGEAKGDKPKLLPRDAFDKKLVVAVTHNGMRTWKYKVTRVTADGDTLYVQYQAGSTVAYPNSYVCPLIVSVAKGKYASVVFIENGSKLGTATIGTGKGKSKKK
jgi:hypothetical protein